MLYYSIYPPGGHFLNEEELEQKEVRREDRVCREESDRHPR